MHKICSAHSSPKGIGEKVVKITEQYLDGEISAEDAYDEIGIYYDTLEAIPEEEDDTGELSLLQTYVLVLHTNFLTGQPDEEIKDTLNSIKKLL